MIPLTKGDFFYLRCAGYFKGLWFLCQTIAQETQSSIKYRTKTFQSLLQQVKPIPENFDIDQAKEDYFKEKYKNLT